MPKSTAAKVATFAGRGTLVVFAASVVSCVMSTDDMGPSLGFALFGGLLSVLALGALIVWVTARDVAGDDPPAAPSRKDPPQ